MVPKDWELMRLGKVSEIVTSGSRDWAQYYSESGSKFIRMTNLRRDGIYLKLDDLKYVDVNSNSSDGKRTSLRHGDILISITAELGKIGWIPEQFGEAYINQHTALVRLKKNIVSSLFVAYVLSSKHMHYVINSLNDAGAKAGLNLPTIRGIPVLIPPLPEQRKIAKILCTWDRAIEVAEKLLSNSQQQKKSLMQQLLTGKKRFPDFNGEWVRVKFEKILRIEIGGTPSRSNPQYWDDQKQTQNRWLSIADLKGNKISNTKEYISDLGVKNSNVSLVPAGTVVMSFKLTIGRRALLEADSYTNEAICALLIKDTEILDKIYLFYALEIVDFDQEIDQAVKGKTLNKAKLKRLRLNLPPLKEQQKITTVLSAADKEIEAFQQKLDCLKQEKKALMQQLLTGKRRVKVDEEEISQKEAVRA